MILEKSKIRFLNTLSKTTEDFTPISDDKILIYCCGPTVYDDIHIGNTRPIIVVDALVSFLKRFFKKQGQSIIYLRNITDIDEKIMNRCKELNKNYKDFIEEQIKEFNRITQFIQTNNPITCRVTENIENIIEDVLKIIQQGFAYVTELGNVYFRVKNFQDYKILAGKKRQDMASVSVENKEDKEHWEDFALWKSLDPANVNEVYWESPWGPGVPGWHMECSSMCTHHLGPKIDIHCGGQDLIFPHHDNEIAQCWALHHHIFANYWLHNGMVLVEGKKMSKSLGNFIKLKEVVTDKESGDILKYMMLNTHYHQPLNFTQRKLEDARNNVNKIKNFIKNNKDLFNKNDYDFFCEGERQYLLEDLTHNFNTPQFLVSIHGKIKNFKLETSVEKKKNYYYEIIFMLESISLMYN